MNRRTTNQKEDRKTGWQLLTGKSIKYKHSSKQHSSKQDQCFGSTTIWYKNLIFKWNTHWWRCLSSTNEWNFLYEIFRGGLLWAHAYNNDWQWQIFLSVKLKWLPISPFIFLSIFHIVSSPFWGFAYVLYANVLHLHYKKKKTDEQNEKLGAAWRPQDNESSPHFNFS